MLRSSSFFLVFTEAVACLRLRAKGPSGNALHARCSRGLENRARLHYVEDGRGHDQSDAGECKPEGEEPGNIRSEYVIASQKNANLQHRARMRTRHWPSGPLFVSVQAALAASGDPKATEAALGQN